MAKHRFEYDKLVNFYVQVFGPGDDDAHWPRDFFDAACEALKKSGLVYVRADGNLDTTDLGDDVLDRLVKAGEESPEIRAICHSNT